MRKTPSIIVMVLLFIVSVSTFSQSPADTAIWNEFVRLVRSHRFPVEKIHPLLPGSEQMVLGFLKILGDSVSEKEWDQQPEIHRAGDLVHFVLPLGEGAQIVPYSFSFEVENGTWYFHHLESITIRLDRIQQYPVSRFPDIPEDKKAWIRQEFYWSQMVNLFNSFYCRYFKNAGWERPAPPLPLMNEEREKGPRGEGEVAPPRTALFPSTRSLP